ASIWRISAAPASNPAAANTAPARTSAWKQGRGFIALIDYQSKADFGETQSSSSTAEILNGKRHVSVSKLINNRWSSPLESCPPCKGPVRAKPRSEMGALFRPFRPREQP